MPISVHRDRRRAVPAITPWATGRFYGSSVLVGTLGTSTPGANAYWLPIFIPNAVTLTSIGCEVTIAGGTGSLLRLGLYTMSSRAMPERLILDSGAIAVDSGTGFKSASISQPMLPGWYFLAMASLTVTSNPTYRGVGGGQMWPVLGGGSRTYLLQMLGMLYTQTGGGEWAQYGFPNPAVTSAITAVAFALYDITHPAPRVGT
jgi:hypothetical protein